MRRIYPHQLDARYKIIVTFSDDDAPDSYIWTVICDGKDFEEGYAPTEEAAFTAALLAYNTHMNWIETGVRS